ncbi:MAG: hypothetical protein ACTTH7_01780 [Treponema sp.]
MKTKIYAIFFIAFIPFFYVYGASFDVNGPWVPKSQYEYWKTGEAEEISVKEVTVGKITYLKLTHSIMINQYAKPPVFCGGASGQWELVSIVKETVQRYILKLRSFKNKDIMGELYTTVLQDGSIYFEEGKGNSAFKHEFAVNTDLSLGNDNIYVRCDVKK